MSEKLILLVEDNPDDEELTLLALKRANVANKVVVARDGEEALHYLFAEGKYKDSLECRLPELILIDLKLPKVGGLEVLQRIRADSRIAMIPVVILTSSDEEEDVIAGCRLGANSFVRKPVDFQQFAEVVQQIGMYWLLVNRASLCHASTTLAKDVANEEESPS